VDVEASGVGFAYLERIFKSHGAGEVELAIHAKVVHGMTAIPPDVGAKIRQAIKEG
jgi:predicted small metal-binding protein